MSNPRVQFVDTTPSAGITVQVVIAPTRSSLRVAKASRNVQQATNATLAAAVVMAIVRTGTASHWIAALLRLIFCTNTTQAMQQ